MSTTSPPASPLERVRSGRLVAGLLLVLFGVGWLLEVLDVIDFPWDVLLPIALVLVGVALVVASRSGTRPGGLIAVGVVLTGVMVIGSAIDFPLGGGVGEREERPATIAALRDEYRLGIGQLTVDLTNLSTAELDADARTRVRVGIGQLVVIVPEGLAVLVEARATVGNVRVFEDEEGGFGVEREAGPGLDARGPVLELVLSVGLGEVEVRRG
ncbi:MAG: LiaF domain-containing protein [Actinomycetota bacterium]